MKINAPIMLGLILVFVGLALPSIMATAQTMGVLGLGSDAVIFAGTSIGYNTILMFAGLIMVVYGFLSQTKKS